jgi:hypothetical protein
MNRTSTRTAAFSGATALAVAALATIVLATRTDHFGGAFSLPDATLAVFFLAGLWVGSLWALPALLLAAGLADQWAFAQGVSDWCVSPAYGFLVPTYACLWWSGRASRNLEIATLGGAGRLAAHLFWACLAAFVISSGSFFLLSGRFPGMSGIEYWRDTAQYFVPYAGWAFAYVSVAVAVRVAVARVRSGFEASTGTREPRGARDG